MRIVYFRINRPEIFARFQVPEGSATLEAMGGILDKRITLARPELPCDPPFWARGPHLQTVAANYLPSPVPALPWERIRLDLDDGDAMALRVVEGGSGVVVHLFHGLGGSADGHYMQRVAARLHALGHTVLAANHRGAGEGAGWSRHSYNSGSTPDLSAVLRFGRTRFPGRLQVAVGFSISANMLLLLLGLRGAELPDRAIAVNPPVDLEACSRRLVKGFNRCYDRYFVRLLRREVMRRPGARPLAPARTMRDLDAVYTAPQAGYPSRDAYYAQCSSGPHLGRIQVPTVILTSLDDPFASGGDVVKCALSPAVHLHAEPHGGHMGYLSRNLAGFRWLDYALEHYLRCLLDPAIAKHPPAAQPDAKSMRGILQGPWADVGKTEIRAARHEERIEKD
jgi:predicted alpha/beta-fold hydrolase